MASTILGKPLHTFARDMTPGKSACYARGCTAWPPLMGDAAAKDMGDWSVVTRDDGSKQWAYKGKPLYTYAKDTATNRPPASRPSGRGRVNRRFSPVHPQARQLPYGGGEPADVAELVDALDLGSRRRKA